MTEGRSDLEASLADIDHKLQELQRELQAVAGPGEPAEAAAPVAPPPTPPAAPDEPARLLDDTAARVAELGRRIEDLGRLGRELEEATRALQDEFARSARRGPATWSGDVVVRAGPFRDIASLGDFERAVGGIAGVQEAYVRSFAGDRALLELRLAGELDLVGELRRALPWELRVVDSGPGELEIGLGS